MNNFLIKQKIFYVLGTLVLVLSLLNIIFVPFVSYAEFNQQINYQGKLTNSSGVAVADGDYNMNFWLLSSSTAPTSTALWSEVRTGVDKVTITNGLFSVMLGEVSSLAGVDFNQTLYLGIEIGGTGSPTWDGEMTPRKILGAVPAAFVAETANTFSGLATTSFLRADDSDTMEATSSSALLTLIQNGAGKIMSLFSGASEVFTVLNSGNIGIGTTTPSHKLTVNGNTYLGGNLSLTGSFSDSINATGTSGQILSSTGTSTRWTSTSTLGLGNGTFLGLTDTPSSYTANRLIFTNSGATALTDSANLTFDGTNLGLGNQSYIAFGGVNYLYASSTNNSIVFGESAGETFSSSTAYNVALGYFAGQNASTTGEYSNSIGHFAGYSNTGSENNIFGSSAGYANTGSYNNIFGSSSGYENTGLTNNIIGTSAGYSNTGSENNIFGSSAGYANTGSHNNILGLDAGYANTGSYNNIFGFSAGQANIGSYNEFIGSEAANNLQATSSVIVGSRAFYGSGGTFQAVNNTALGYRAGYAAQTGASNNILLGYQAADNLTTGANNIVIGYDVDIASTTGSNQLNIGNLIFGTGIDGTGTTLSSGNIGIGTTTPAARLAIEKLNFSGSGVAGLDQYFSFKNTVASAVQFADKSYIYATNTATTTMVGSIIRIEDSNLFGNTVRGLEVQTDRGTNTLGENTALSGFARTFGVRGVTSGDAGGTYEPAGIFGETEGTTQGNAIRGYSSTITTASLLKLFQDTSTFTGTGLLMNFGNSGGSFSSTTASKFIDLQNAGTSMFTVGAYGKLTIGDGTTNHNAGVQVGYGGICVDNDGSCNASTTGRISAVSYHTGNSDLAETYFSNDNLQAGEIVYLKEGLSIGRASTESKDKILGVVSTKPGLLLGFDDTSLTKSEKSYPIALKGRVPIRLSNENGEIKAGDELMLSSISGVAMKASSTGMVIGIALEDFVENRAYSDTYINQFGDDIAEPDFTPISKNNDPRINDGCYFGGGNASGQETCVPLVSTTTDGQIKEAESIAVLEAERKALEKLKNIKSSTVVLDNGAKVNVGQIVMFVDFKYRYLDDNGIKMINHLLAKASSTNSDITNDETVWERLVQLANNFVDGVLSVFTLKADRVEVKNELCVDGVCLNSDDLRNLLNKKDINNQEENENTSQNNINTEQEEIINQPNEEINDEETNTDLELINTSVENGIIEESSDENTEITIEVEDIQESQNNEGVVESAEQEEMVNQEEGSSSEEENTQTTESNQ